MISRAGSIAFPNSPASICYSNAAGETIYVGKARSLRDRVRSYLGARGTSPKTDALLDEAAGLDVILTDSVVEALALENNLIKQRTPKYNILLRDDKNYPYLQLTTTEAFPRVLVARRVERDGNVYAGPFMPASLARQRHVAQPPAVRHPLVQRGDHRAPRPALPRVRHQAVPRAVRRVDLQRPSGTRAAVDDTRLFLEGRTDELLEGLRRRGWSRRRTAERFEQAAQLRDAARTVQTLRDRQQKMATVELGDRDVFGIKTGPAGAVDPGLPGAPRPRDRARGLFADLAPERVGAAEAQATAVPGRGRPVRAGGAPGDAAAVLRRPRGAAGDPPAGRTARRGGRSRRGCRRGPAGACASSCRSAARSAGLLDLAARNAAQAYQARVQPRRRRPLRRPRRRCALALGLPGLPRRIECFDISTIQGRETVASMVVCEDGRMKRSDYRKFRLRPAAEPPAAAGRRPSTPAEPRFLDDFAAMNQVVLRRYRACWRRADRSRT